MARNDRKDGPNGGNTLKYLIFMDTSDRVLPCDQKDNSMQYQDKTPE